MARLLLLATVATVAVAAQEYRCPLTYGYDPSIGRCIDVQGTVSLESRRRWLPADKTAALRRPDKLWQRWPPSDRSNCGQVGRQCPTEEEAHAAGIPRCLGGVCDLQCGYGYRAIDDQCVLVRPAVIAAASQRARARRRSLQLQSICPR